MQIDQKYEVVDISGDGDPLKEHPQNPKRGAVELIDESIEENGWYGAIVAQKSTGYILVGNHRYRVAKEKGAVSIPVIWRDVDDETALRILLVDNKSADAGTYDEEMLHAALSSLTSLDGTGYGSVMHAVEERLAKETEAERAKEEAKDLPPEPPTSSSADVPAATDIPDDVYTPQFGIMVVCSSEEDQAETYDALKVYFEDRSDERDMRVVAV